MNIPHWIPWKLDKFPFPLSVLQHTPKSITTAVSTSIMHSGEKEREGERERERERINTHTHNSYK
jgi:hypothetical protein